MITKLFEIRDRHTMIPVLAIEMTSDERFEMTAEDIAAQNYLLRRAGYGSGIPALVLLIDLAGGHGRSTCDPYDWGSSRTWQVAHEHIAAKFHELKDCAVIDVEYILGETKAPKRSDRETEAT